MISHLWVRQRTFRRCSTLLSIIANKSHQKSVLVDLTLFHQLSMHLHITRMNVKQKINSRLNLFHPINFHQLTMYRTIVNKSDYNMHSLKSSCLKDLSLLVLMIMRSTLWRRTCILNFSQQRLLPFEKPSFTNSCVFGSTFQNELGCLAYYT